MKPYGRPSDELLLDLDGLDGLDGLDAQAVWHQCGEEWEEKNLLSWLNAHRALPWKARSHAYSAQYQV
jgi:hypothetical protein